jgi:hypothetical protein
MGTFVLLGVLPDERFSGFYIISKGFRIESRRIKLLKAFRLVMMSLCYWTWIKTADFVSVVS